MFINNSVSSGAPAITDPTGTCLNVGTPVAKPNGITFDIPFTLKYRMDQVQKFTDITQLCDAYKIKYIKHKIWCGVSGVGMTVNSAQPTIKWITDHDDADMFTIDLLQEKQGVIHQGFYNNKPVVMGVVPKVAGEVYREGGVTPGYFIPKSVWLNSTYTTIPHYAIKGILCDVDLRGTAGGSELAGVLTQFRIETTAYICGKDFQ